MFKKLLSKISLPSWMRISIPRRERLSRIPKSLFYLFIGVWPILVGIAFEISERLKSSIEIAWRVFLKSFIDTSYSIDWWMLIFIVITFVWGWLFFRSIIIEDRKLNQRFKELQAFIQRAPDFESYLEAKTFYDYSSYYLEKLEPHEIQYKKNDFSQIEDLIGVFDLITKSAIKLTASFFQKGVQGYGGNFMVYLDNTEENKPAIAKLIGRAESKTYFRDGNEANLKGILYLDEALVTLVNGFITRNIPTLVMPVYSNAEEMYVDPQYYGQNKQLPGAILALTAGTSMVGDTGDAKKYYSGLTQKTIDEVKTYFDGSGKDVNSFASFRVPSSTEAEKDDCVGVFNLDCIDEYAFGRDEEFFHTLYTMLYPTLRLYSKYLEYYRNYLILN